MTEKIVKLDVREDIRQGREPFSKIMVAAGRLKSNEALLLIAPFEPRPLFGVLGQQGFTHESKPTEAGDWEVLFRREPEPAPAPAKKAVAAASAKPAGRPACGCAAVREVDARGLEPPQPLVTILEALADLPEDTELRAQTDRRPMHLYPQLKERGFVGESKEQADGSFITYIRRK